MVFYLLTKKKNINMGQLNASLSNAVTIKDRLRFFYYYMADEKPSRQRRRAIYQKVWAITTSKDTSYFDLNIEKLRIWQVLHTWNINDGGEALHSLPV